MEDQKSQQVCAIKNVSFLSSINANVARYMLATIILAHWKRISEILLWDRSSCLTHAFYSGCHVSATYIGCIETHSHCRQVT